MLGVLNIKPPTREPEQTGKGLEHSPTSSEHAAAIAFAYNIRNCRTEDLGQTWGLAEEQVAQDAAAPKLLPVQTQKPQTVKVHMVLQARPTPRSPKTPLDDIPRLTMRKESALG